MQDGLPRQQRGTRHIVGRIRLFAFDLHRREKYDRYVFKNRQKRICPHHSYVSGNWQIRIKEYGIFRILG